MNGAGYLEEAARLALLGRAVLLLAEARAPRPHRAEDDHAKLLACSSRKEHSH